MRISDWSSDVCSSDLPVLANWQALIDYLTARLAHQTIESVRVLPLNTRNILIRDEEMSRGSIDESEVSVCEEIGRAHVCTSVTNTHLVCRPLLEQIILYHLIIQCDHNLHT